MSSRLAAAPWTGVRQSIRLPAVKFHESFWAVAGTLAPLLFLGNVVALDVRAKRVRGWGKPRRPKEIDRLVSAGAILGTVAWYLVTLSEAAVMVLALQSLASERDVVPVTVITDWLLSVVILLLLALVMPMLTAELKALRSFGWQPPDPRADDGDGQPAADDSDPLLAE